MADVNLLQDRGEGTDRGQLILVGGIVVALTLVALVVLLNMTLFAGNLATRGIDPGVDRSHDHAAFTEHAGQKILSAENAPEANHDTWMAVHENVMQDVESVGTITENHTLRRFGGHSSVSVGFIRRGAVLIQNDSRPFTSAGNESDQDWRLTTTKGIRDYSMTVNETGTENPKSLDNAFTLRIEGDGGNGASWYARVNSTSDNKVRLQTSTDEMCESTAPATINWTEGTFHGCSFEFATNAGTELSPPLKVTYENGENASGTYRLIVSNQTSAESINKNKFNDPLSASPESPWWYPAVYSLVLETTYREGDTHYATHVRVAPDESSHTSPK